ncbi:MAG: Fur family transcriptional regulator [Pseudomonadota bacterium]
MVSAASHVEDHDHSECVDTALRKAESICAARGLRLTALRKQVLTLVWDSHAPVGAYDILDKMAEQGQRKAPPTVYRALEFLLEAGLIHRLDSLNAFIGCAHPGAPHNGQFLICGECNQVIEIHANAVQNVVQKAASEHGFVARHAVLEVQGTCADCQ